MINWSASERARGEYMFHLQVGSHEDESILMARYLADLGLKRVGVLYDRSPIGRRHMEFLEQEADLLGVNVSTRKAVAPLATDVTDDVAALRDEGVEGLVYMGLGWVGRDIAKARTALGWEVPRIMNAAGMRGADPDYAHDIDGWVYPDMYSDDNVLLSQLRASLTEDRRRVNALAFGYDMGQLVAEGIARAPELSREGIKDGLEHIKVMRAAEGHEGTTLGFGRWERGALKGRYLVLRQWRSGVSVAASTSCPIGPLKGRYLAMRQSRAVFRRLERLPRSGPGPLPVAQRTVGTTVMWRASSPGTSPPRMRKARSRSSSPSVWVWRRDTGYSPSPSDLIA